MRDARSPTADKAAQATRLKKAWILYKCIVGTSHFTDPVHPVEFWVPEYTEWERDRLWKEVEDLKEDLWDLHKVLVTSGREAMVGAVDWLAAGYDRWAEERFGVYTLCTVRQWEGRVGVLTAHAKMDIPPYAEMLLQGAEFGVAFRHPEYMLARDLELVFNLARDAESLVAAIDWRRPPDWATAASENCLALNRTVIQTCFNLLESFTSGLGRGHVMTHPGLSAKDSELLVKNMGTVDERLLRILKVITGGHTCGLDSTKPPLRDLFGRIKQQRNAFVHCESGPQTTKGGYVKEAVFHDVPWAAAQEAVALTLDTIKQVWKHLHGRDKPTWLPEPGTDGRFPGTTLRLSPGPMSFSPQR